MTRSIEPVAADPERRLSEPVAVQPEISRPLPRTFARFVREPSLSHGAVVEASILARLLGIRLLRLDARIDMVPTDSDSIVERYTTVPAIELSASPVAPGTSDEAAGTLADAAELLQHAARTLGEVRRERVAGRW
jgi:hypothetical protein